MHHDLNTIQRGWTVYDTSDEKIGDIADIGSGYVLVQKGLLFIKDLYIPDSAITETDDANGRVYVNVAKGDVDSMGWDQPPAEDTATQRSDFDYGVTAADTASTSGGNISGDVMQEADARRVTLHEEELQAQTRSQQAGEVQVSKRVVEDERQLDVPVTHDEVQVRRVRVDRDATAGDAAFTDDGETIRVPVTAETVEVTKQPRVVEEIEISKRPVTERQTVRDTVRREEADVSQQGDVAMADGTTDRSSDLVGAGTDRFERTSVDDAAGVERGGPRVETDDDARNVGGI
jgi:uncharacterized protein (TIGR02271 family)